MFDPDGILESKLGSTCDPSKINPPKTSKIKTENLMNVKKARVFTEPIDPKILIPVSTPQTNANTIKRPNPWLAGSKNNQYFQLIEQN